jgi:peptide/nickel transport system permease protein
MDRFSILFRGICANPIGLTGLLIVMIVVACALLAPGIAPYDHLKVSMDKKLLPPSMDHLMGTDQAGRDILSRIIWGARIALKVGVLAVVIGLAGGVGIGLISAFYSGTVVDEICMRMIEIIASIPLLIWAIAISGIIGVDPVVIGPLRFPNEDKLILLLGILYIPSIARVTYAEALDKVRAYYVCARRLQGASDFVIMTGDVLPNCLSPVIVQGTLLIAIGIIVEAALSFVGLGVQPPDPSWGGMLADARAHVFSNVWWLALFPGLTISLTVIGFNLLGDALREALDPRRRTTTLVV